MLPPVDINNTNREEVERALIDLRDAMQRELDELSRSVQEAVIKGLIRRIEILEARV